MSNINYKYNNIFVHVPKVAGTSMEAQPFVGGDSHAPAHVLQDIAGDRKWNDTFTWGFIREPLDRFVSAFFHEPKIHQFTKDNKGFREFVYFMHKTGIDIPGAVLGKAHHHHHFIPQYYFLCDESGKILVDFVGRFSQIEYDWEDVSRKITGMSVELPKKRTTMHNHYTSYYAGDDRLVGMVRELYKQDYKIFEEF